MDSRDDEDLREFLDRGEPNDTLGRRHMLREVERGLFGADAEDPASVGRYRLISRIASGGQGTVWVGHDPELQRDVAIKLVRSDRRSPDARARLLREATALAQLSHPNVVAVNDVGECEAGVFIVTQLVQGRTLARWLERPRPWRDVVDVFVAAGTGLVASHERGIVHRDFKPANVILADGGGAIQLLDFGLARAHTDDDSSEVSGDVALAGDHATETGHVVGTPVYMAPEQHHGQAATPAADQYAFCVALFEALAGRRPFAGDSYAEYVRAKQEWPPTWPRTPALPRELRRLVERGLAPDPADRWPSMQIVVERLRALSRSRSTVWIAAISLGTLGLVAAAVIVGGRSRAGCAHADVLRATWSPERRNALTEAFVASGQPLAADAATRTIATIDGFAQSWSIARTEACAAVGTEPGADLRIACLDRERTALDEVLRVLERADASLVLHADDVVRQLGSPRQCAQSWDVPPSPAIADAVASARASIAHARALGGAGLHSDAAAELARVVITADAVGDPALQAEAALAHGTALRALRELDAAQSTLERAYLSAESDRDDEIAFAAALELAQLHGIDREDVDRGHEWLRRTEAALARLGSAADPVADGELARVTAGVAERAGDYPTAIAQSRRAAERLEAELGAADLRVVRAVRSLAKALVRAGELDDAEATARRALEMAQDAVGPEHPETAAALRIVGWVQRHRGQLDESLETQRRVYALFEAAYGREHPELATTLENIAVLHSEMGRPHEAEEAYRRVLEIYAQTLAADDPAIARALHNYAITLRDLGRGDEASTAWREAIAIAERSLGPDHLETAIFQTIYAGHLADSGQIDEGLALAERALDVLRRTAGEEHARTLMAWAMLGHIQRLARQLPKAHESLDRAVDIARVVYGPDHPDYARLLHEVANLRAEEGDPAGAVPIHERAIAIAEASLGPHHTAVGEMLVDLASRHEALGHHREAARARARAAAIRKAADVQVQPQPDD